MTETDPTKLTTDALEKALDGVQKNLDDLKELVEAKIQVEHEHAESLANAVHRHIGGMEAFRDQKFGEVDRRFQQVETQRVEQKSDTKQAVDVALATSAKQLEELRNTFITTIDSIRREIGDLKDRVTTGEASKLGATGANTTLYALAGFILVVLVIAAALTAHIH